jgi:hypothetical protein
MRSSTRKKRVGRPPGRIAPHRPVLSASARISQELYDALRESARINARSISEEVAKRVELSFVWERAHRDADAMLADVKRVAREGKKVALAKELREQGHTYVRGMNGGAWFDPGVDAIKWIFFNVDPESRVVLQEMLDQAATRAVERMRAQP